MEEAGQASLISFLVTQTLDEEMLETEAARISSHIHGLTLDLLGSNHGNVVENGKFSIPVIASMYIIVLPLPDVHLAL